MSSRTDHEEERAEYLREQVGLLADETRLRIVQALWDHRFDAVPYAELQRAVGVRDSGRFNYHLDALREAFVRKTDEGYLLSASAATLYQTLLSMHPPVESSERTLSEDVGTCYRCGAALEARYEDEWVTVRCTDCGTALTKYSLPPGAFEGRSMEAVLEAFEGWTRHHLELAMEGACPNCAGVIAVDWVREDVGRYPYDPVFVHHCETCRSEWFVAAAWLVWDHPEVVSLLYDHGVDVREVPLWEVPRYLPPGETAVVAEDPLEVELVATVGDERFTILADGDLDVLSIEARNG